MNDESSLGKPAGTVVLRAVLAPAVVGRCAAIAAVVGTVLNGINQGDALFGTGEVQWSKVALNYAVPFCVASYGAYCALRQARAGCGRRGD